MNELIIKGELQAISDYVNNIDNPTEQNLEIVSSDIATAKKKLKELENKFKTILAPYKQKIDEVKSDFDTIYNPINIKVKQLSSEIVAVQLAIKEREYKQAQELADQATKDLLEQAQEVDNSKDRGEIFSTLEKFQQEPENIKNDRKISDNTSLRVTKKYEVVNKLALINYLVANNLLDAIEIKASYINNIGKEIIVADELNELVDEKTGIRVYKEVGLMIR